MSKEGWNWLFNAKKEHYFRNGRSLCGRWLCLGGKYSPEPPSDKEAICTTCLKKREKEKGK